MLSEIITAWQGRLNSCGFSVAIQLDTNQSTLLKFEIDLHNFSLSLCSIA